MDQFLNEPHAVLSCFVPDESTQTKTDKASSSLSLRTVIARILGELLERYAVCTVLAVSLLLTVLHLDIVIKQSHRISKSPDVPLQDERLC